MKSVPGRTDHVVVVGAGLAGLSAALHLLGAGRRVTVVERGSRPGGRAGLIDDDGYRIDTGPTVLTMPDLLDEALGAVGDSLRDRLDLVRLDPAYRAVFADGSTIDVHGDPLLMEEQVRQAAGPAEAAGYRRLRTWLEELYRVQMRSFIDANFDSPLGLVGRDLARLTALGGFGRLGPKIGSFLKDDRLRRIYSFQSLYAGVAPARALAAYAVIAYMDTVAGVFFPRGGMHAVPRALADAAADAGADLRFGQPVTAVERSGSGRVTAVRTAQGERLGCDALVVTADLPAAYHLLGRSPRRVGRLRWSPSAFLLHLGTDRRWDGLAHHTLSFGRAWDTTFTELTRTGEVMSDPSLLLTNPTVTDPGLAPADRHLHHVLAPCPNLETGPIDWERTGAGYRDRLVAELERRGLTGLGEAVRFERMVTPADWRRDGLAAGTPFSAAHTFRQTGPFRPRNLVPGEENVVLAGCGTTPGVGVPTVLVSGKLAAARITGTTSTGRPRATGMRLEVSG